MTKFDIPATPSTQTQLVCKDFPKPSLIRLFPRCSPSKVRMARTTLPMSQYWQNAYDELDPCFLMSISYRSNTKQLIKCNKINSVQHKDY